MAAKTTTDAATGEVLREGDWYSHFRNGDHRPNQDIRRAYKPAEWKKMADKRPLTRQALGKIAFAADIELCRNLGLHQHAQVTWLSLTTEQRVAWMDSGPKKPAERANLWKSIMKTLKPLSS